MNPPNEQQVEVPAEALKQGRDACDAAYHGQGHALDEAFALGLEVAAPAIRRQAAQQERERVKEALKRPEVIREASKALAPDAFAWARRRPGIEVDGAACIDAAFDALATKGQEGRDG